MKRISLIAPSLVWQASVATGHLPSAGTGDVSRNAPYNHTDRDVYPAPLLTLGLGFSVYNHWVLMLSVDPPPPGKAFKFMFIPSLLPGGDSPKLSQAHNN